MNTINEIIIGDDLLKFLPQRAPIVMISKLIAYSSQGVISELNITDENIFVHKGYFQVPGLIENVAQTAAVFGSYEAVQKNEAAPLGFIGAVKNFQLHKLAQVNTVLRTKIDVLHQVMGATIIKGEVFCKEELLAEMEMKIFLDEK